MSNKEFQIIGAGLPRTGSLSLMTALEILLPGKCHHGMKTHKHEKEWLDIFTDEEPEKIKDFLTSNEYVAGVDVPINMMYMKVMEAFPAAKVVLTVRDPERWVQSFAIFDTLYTWSPIPLFKRLGLFPKYISSYSLHGDLCGMPKSLIEKYIGQNKRFLEMYSAVAQGKGVEFFTEWVQGVEATVPKDRLLTFHVKEGWGPLCEFLNVPVPNVPFPNVNSKDEIESFINRNKRRSWVLVYEFISIPLLCYGLYVLSKK